ncbi:hypothetical protein C0993_009988 [Termitomyces sp. T159_Od127]|nr:hypothetical protein C0993_009988 [Termitomyces sp. T159_Od127]
MASRRKGTSKQLRQTTLLESPKASACSSKTSSQVGRKRKQKTRISQTDASSDNDDDDRGISSIKFAPKACGHGSDDDSVVAHAPKRRKTLIVDSDDSERVARQRKPCTKKSVSRDSDADDAAEQPRRRKLKKKRDVALVSSTDDEELAEEVDKERIIESRLRNRNKKSAFQKNLEKLKRRKQGKPSGSSSSPNEGSANSDDDAIPFKGAKPSSDFDSLFDEDSGVDSCDFIVEDDNSVVATLPMEFSMESHEDLDHQFKKIFQFFVHIAVRPAKERHHFMEEQLYPWCQAGSDDSLVQQDKDHSDCSVSNDSDDDSDDNDTNSKKEKVAAEFHLGRFCARRTRVYHEFTHWEVREVLKYALTHLIVLQYALFKCIRDEVDELHENRQSRGFFRIAYVGGVEPPKDLDDADGICDWLDQRKVIDMEWMKIKDMMESARHLELDRKKDDDD